MRILRRGLSVHVFGVVASLAMAAVAGAQRPQVLYGAVTNLNGVPIPGVTLLVAGTNIRAVTNDSGTYVIEAPPTGRVRMTARRIGFREKEQGFKIDAGVNRRVDFELEGIPELLDSVTIMTQQGGTHRMAEFWNRRMLGVGAFITRADIEKRKPFQPSDLLRTVVGVRVMGDNAGMNRPVITMGRTGIGMTGYRNTQSRAADCRVNFYVDGMWMPTGTFHPDDLSSVSIEAMEIYRGASETPTKFRQRETACGLVVIWTREPPPRDRADTNLTHPSPTG